MTCASPSSFCAHFRCGCVVRLCARCHSVSVLASRCASTSATSSLPRTVFWFITTPLLSPRSRQTTDLLTAQRAFCCRARRLDRSQARSSWADSSAQSRAGATARFSSIPCPAKEQTFKSCLLRGHRINNRIISRFLTTPLSSAALILPRCTPLLDRARLCCQVHQLVLYFNLFLFYF